MAYEISNYSVKVTLVAAADLSALQYTFVKLNSSGQAAAVAAATSSVTMMNKDKNSNAGGSTISASDLNEMKNDNFPNKSKRKQKSERTSISLDI